MENPQRKVTYPTPKGSQKCDNSVDAKWTNNKATDWQGKDWYRVSDIIGTRIPTSPTKGWHCGVWASGWIKQDSDPAIWETKIAKACFAPPNMDNCRYSETIKVRNCGDFLLYYLTDARQMCNSGYCVE